MGFLYVCVGSTGKTWRRFFHEFVGKKTFVGFFVYFQIELNICKVFNCGIEKSNGKT